MFMIIFPMIIKDKTIENFSSLVVVQNTSYLLVYSMVLLRFYHDFISLFKEISEKLYYYLYTVKIVLLCTFEHKIS